MAKDDVEAYLLRAEEYRTMAGEYRDPLTRSMLLRLADDWDRMADRTEKSSDDPLNPGPLAQPEGRIHNECCRITDMTAVSPVPRDDFAGKSVLAALSADAIRLLRSDLEEAHFREGAVLWNERSDATQVFFPISGSISVGVPAGNAHGVEIATIGPEGAAGFHHAPNIAPVITQAVVQSSGRFATITASAFNAAAHDCDELQRLAALCKSWLLRQTQLVALCNAAHSGEARFCRWLLRASDALGSAMIRVTQEKIADFLGLRRTTVNLIAQQSQLRGAIACGRGKILIRDRAALQSAACDCYTALSRNHWPSELLRAHDPPPGNASIRAAVIEIEPSRNGNVSFQ